MGDSNLNDVNEPGKNRSDDFRDETITFWQPSYPDRTLTREDARQIIQNVAGFFSVLRGWAEAEAVATAEGETDESVTDSGDEAASGPNRP